MARTKKTKLRSRPKTRSKPVDATALMNDTPFPFLDLPAEVRRQVYGYLVVEAKAVALLSWEHNREPKMPNSLRRATPQGLSDHRVRSGVRQIRDDEDGRWRAAPPAPCSIILANKQTYLEAIPLLYGENEFQFESAKALRNFLATIGRSGQHLRFVTLLKGGITAGDEYKDAMAAFKDLAVAKSLKRLRIDHAFVCTTPPLQRPSYYSPPISISQLVADCSKLLHTLRKSYIAQNIARDVLDVVDCYPAECEKCAPGRPRPLSDHDYRADYGYVGQTLCGCRCGSQVEMSERAMAQFKEQMAEHLGQTE